MGTLCYLHQILYRLLEIKYYKTANFNSSYHLCTTAYLCVVFRLGVSQSDCRRVHGTYLCLQAADAIRSYRGNWQPVTWWTSRSISTAKLTRRKCASLRTYKPLGGFKSLLQLPHYCHNLKHKTSKSKLTIKPFTTAITVATTGSMIEFVAVCKLFVAAVSSFNLQLACCMI
jgi:hypothetical protein